MNNIYNALTHTPLQSPSKLIQTTVNPMKSQVMLNLKQLPQVLLRERNPTGSRPPF
jgi:hypothetical protein